MKFDVMKWAEKPRPYCNYPINGIKSGYLWHILSPKRSNLVATIYVDCASGKIKTFLHKDRYKNDRAVIKLSDVQFLLDGVAEFYESWLDCGCLIQEQKDESFFDDDSAVSETAWDYVKERRRYMEET